MESNLRDILTSQKQTIDRFEQEIKNIETLDLLKENTSLKTETEKLRIELDVLRKKYDELAEQSSRWRNALNERLYAEKISFVDKSEEKLEIYFANKRLAESNTLISLENRSKAYIDEQIEFLRRDNYFLEQDYIEKLQELREEINEQISAARAKAFEVSAVPEEIKNNYRELRSEAVTDEQMAEIARKNNFERFIGLNIINKIGILLIIIGVIAASQYTYSLLGDVAKGGLIFVLGVVMLGLGEFLSRKKANIFSLGMSAGGVAVIYAALTISYFTLKIIPIYPSAILCMLITVGAFFLSIRHSSQVIATFTIIGGFLPLLIIRDALNYALTYSAMAYFVILGAFALSLSFRKKWIVTAFVGLVLNTISTIYISGFFDKYSPASDKAVLLAYLAASFIIYTLIPVIGTYREKLSFKKSDVVLIGINTFFCGFITFFTLNSLNLSDFHGLLAALFMVIYIGLGQFVKRKMHEEGDMYSLFFLTATVFFILIVPMQLDIIWFSLGWLLQGFALSIYGILSEKERFVKSGFVINGLCLVAFLFNDVMNFRAELFEYKYFAITACAVLILAAFAFKQRDSYLVKAYKYCAVVNLWIFLIYITRRAFDVYAGEIQWLNANYLYFAVCIFITFLIGVISTRIKPIADRGMRILSHVLYWIGIGVLFLLNCFSKPLRYDFSDSGVTPPISTSVLASLLIIGICLLSVLALADILRHFAKASSMRIEWFPFLLSGYFMIILTQTLVGYWNIPFTGMAISLVYAALALMWCIFGFVKRFVFMRRFGLALSLMVVAKLFLLDLYSLTQGYRIITYFSLGVALILVSAIYQYFTKKFEIKTDK